MTSRTSFDTNILIYSIDMRDKHKHSIAERLVGACSDAGSPIALQSLGEFFNAVTRKSLLGSSYATDVLNTMREALKVVNLFKLSEEELSFLLQ